MITVGKIAQTSSNKKLCLNSCDSKNVSLIVVALIGRVARGNFNF